MNLVQYGKSRLGDNWKESLEDSKDGKCFSNLILVITFLSYFAIFVLIIIILLIIIAHNLGQSCVVTNINITTCHHLISDQH